MPSRVKVRAVASTATTLGRRIRRVARRSSTARSQCGRFVAAEARLARAPAPMVADDDRSPPATGRRAEELVAARLAAAGWRDRRAQRPHPLRRARHRRPRRPRPGLRRGQGRPRRTPTFGPERPVLAVDRRKQLRVRRLATAWMAERRGRPALRRDPLRRRRRHLRPRRPRRTRQSSTSTRRRSRAGRARAGVYATDWKERRCSGEMPMLLDRLAVLGGRVADVLLEAPAGMLLGAASCM